MQQADSLLQATLDATSDGILVVDRDGRTVMFNRRFAEMWGIPEDVLAIPDEVSAVCASPLASSFDVIRSRDGRTFERSSVPHRQGPEVIGRVWSFRDVTDRVRAGEAVEALTASEQRYRSITETSPDGVVTADVSGRITGWNPAAARIFGYGAEEILGRPLTDLMPEGQREAHVAAMRRVDDAPPEWGRAVEVRALHRDGATFPCEISLGCWGEGDRREFGAIARDVSERHRMQAHVVLTDRMASVGTLAAGVAHEVNSPLSALLANVSLAFDLLSREAPLSRAVQGEIRDLLGDARTGAERVRQVVRDLRIFAHDDDDAESAVVDLRAVVESAVHLAWNEVRHRARLVKDYRAPAFVVGNESRLCQVVLHLLVNAAQAIPEGAADRHEVRVAIGNDGGHALIEVSDTGAGISDDVRPRLFEPFITSRPGVSAGLGLAICHRIVTALGGSIAVDSSAAGSTFRVVLPCAPPPTAVAAPRPLGEGEGPGGRLLVVDDDPLVLRLLVRMLGAEHRVTATRSAAEALAAIGRGEAYDLVLCDLMMPEVSGVEFYERLVRTHPALAARIVFVTGGAFTPAARAFLARTRHVVVDKPFDVAALRELVRDALRRGAQAADPPGSGGKTRRDPASGTAPSES